MARIRPLILVAFGLFAAPPARAMPPDFVRLSEFAPDIRQDMRYAGADNFTGRPVPGYDAPVCWLKQPAARALAIMAAGAAREGFRPVVWDCYRPKQATDALLRWSADDADQSQKRAYFPRLAKRDLFARGYIGRKSVHSTGYAVDIGLERADGSPVDFGGGFDLFDTRSFTASMEVAAAARTNRATLARLMSQAGFRNLTREWWHYFLPDQPETAYDAAIEP